MAILTASQVEFMVTTGRRLDALEEAVAQLKAAQTEEQADDSEEEASE